MTLILKTLAYECLDMVTEVSRVKNAISLLDKVDGEETETRPEVEQTEQQLLY